MMICYGDETLLVASDDVVLVSKCIYMGGKEKDRSGREQVYKKVNQIKTVPTTK